MWTTLLAVVVGGMIGTVSSVWAAHKAASNNLEATKLQADENLRITRTLARDSRYADDGRRIAELAVSIRLWAQTREPVADLDLISDMPTDEWVAFLAALETSPSPQLQDMGSRLLGQRVAFGNLRNLRNDHDERIERKGVDNYDDVDREERAKNMDAVNSKKTELEQTVDQVLTIVRGLINPDSSGPTPD